MSHLDVRGLIVPSDCVFLFPVSFSPILLSAVPGRTRPRDSRRLIQTSFLSATHGPISAECGLRMLEEKCRFMENHKRAVCFCAVCIQCDTFCCSICALCPRSKVLSCVSVASVWCHQILALLFCPLSRLASGADKRASCFSPRRGPNAVRVQRLERVCRIHFEGCLRTVTPTCGCSDLTATLCNLIVSVCV